MDLSATHVGNAAIITVAGEVDVDTAYELYLAAVKQADEGFAQVVLDLQRVTFVDSVGLGMLIRSRDELANSYESALSLQNPSRQLTTLLELTATTDQFVISRDNEKAPSVEADAELQRGE